MGIYGDEMRAAIVVALCCLLSVPSFGAITIVNCKAIDTGGGSASSVTTGTVSQTAHNMLFAFTSWQNASCGTTTTTITDTAGNAWLPTPAGYHSDTASAICSSMWYVKDAIGGASVTYTATTSVSTFDLSLSVAQFSSTDLSSPLDTTAVGDTGLVPATSATTAPPFTTNAATPNEVLVGGMSSYTFTGTWTADTGYTLGANCQSPSVFTNIQYKVVSTQQVGATTTATKSGITFIHSDVATFKDASQPAIPSIPRKSAGMIQ